MNTRACQKGEFDENSLRFIREAVRIAGLALETTSIEYDRHFVNINHLVEIQPVLFDCRGLLDRPSWIVRRTMDSANAEPCECGVMVRGGEVGSYTELGQAVAAAIAEVIRLKVLTGLQGAAAGSHGGIEAGSTKPKHYPSDFIRHSLHS